MMADRLYFSCDPGEADAYRAAFEKSFGHLFVARVSALNELPGDTAARYIEALRRGGFIDSSMVVVVLVSRGTPASRRIDWDIAAGLEPDAQGRVAGLLGIMLPDVPRRVADDAGPLPVPFFDYSSMPPRLADNVKSGYARIYDWHWLCSDEARVVEALRFAQATQQQRAQYADNSRLRLTYDLPFAVRAVAPDRERRRNP